MGYYDEIYEKRLNRFGKDYQSRVQGQREEEFRRYLLKTIYKTEFVFDNQIQIGSFEKYKQDETQTMHYLLTDRSLLIPNGTVLMMPTRDNYETPWMVYYLEQIRVSGYNRYVMLRMTHYLSWDYQGEVKTSFAYMYGQQDNMLKDEIRSRSRMDAIYKENIKMSFFVMPLNPYIKKDTLILVGEEPYTEQYIVTGYDRQSSFGIEYVTVDPTYIHDTSAIPTLETGETGDNLYWLTGKEPT